MSQGALTFYLMEGPEGPPPGRSPVPKVQPAPLARPLSAVAREIRADYAAKGKPVYYSAKPYVDAMASLGSMEDRFYEDPALDVVIYALSNLSTWRGEVATRVKDELKAAVNARLVAIGRKPTY